MVSLSLSQTTLESGEGLMSPNVHDVASVLKQYLRELPSPLLPHTLTPSLEWAWSCEEVERVEMVMCVLLQLPQPHSQVCPSSPSLPLSLSLSLLMF